MAVLFIPIAMGYHTLYHHWVEKVGPAPTDPAYDTVLAGKSGLSQRPVLLRAGRRIYFAIWIGIATWFRRTSLRKQDETGDPALTLRMARVAAPCMCCSRCRSPSRPSTG